MSEPVDFFLHAPSLAIFVETMPRLLLPDRRFIAELADYPLPDGQSVQFIEDIRCAEIGPVMKVRPVIDAEGNEITPAVVIPGHHVNIRVVGGLATMLTAGMPKTGDIFTRTRILDLLGDMYWVASAVGEPPGYVGLSGVKIFDPATVDQPAREWAWCVSQTMTAQTIAAPITPARKPRRALQRRRS